MQEAHELLEEKDIKRFENLTFHPENIYWQLMDMKGPEGTEMVNMIILGSMIILLRLLSILKLIRE